MREVTSSSLLREENPSPTTTVKTRAIKAKATRISIKLNPRCDFRILWIRIRLPLRNRLVAQSLLVDGTKYPYLHLRRRPCHRHRKRRY